VDSRYQKGIRDATIQMETEFDVKDKKTDHDVLKRVPKVEVTSKDSTDSEDKEEQGERDN
jgi:hypothetical protein